MPKKTEMNIEKIFIQLLDGSTSWVPVDAIRVRNKQVRILDDKEFTNYIDPLYLHEFYPGDIVELGGQTFQDKKIEQVAKKLITKGQWPDRQFNEFKFKATLGLLTISKTTLDKYNSEIERIKKENKAGQFYYPTLLKTIENLEKTIDNE